MLDDITALIDAVLADGEPETGYDYGDPTYPKCRCGEDWHGLPITADMVMMRAVGYYVEAYSYKDDTSAILCPGSDVEGPLRPTPMSERVSETGRFQYVEHFNTDAAGRAQRMLAEIETTLAQILGVPSLTELADDIAATCHLWLVGDEDADD